MPPNVLLLVLDAARRDALAPYSPSADTPTIAALAARGHAAEHAYATSSWTLPSHTSIFTGLLPRAAGLGQPPGGNPQGVRTVLEGLRERLLAERLSRHGYRTHGFSTNLWVSQHSGFDLGFDQFYYVPSGRTERVNALTGGGLRGRLAWAAEGLHSREDDGAEALGALLRGRIAAHDGAPAFWFVNLVECHSPYLPPRPWDDLPARERVRAALDSERYLNFESICRHVAGVQQIPAESLARMRHLYARSVAYMDHWLAGILETLDRRGLLDDTLVIVTSDHGESFDENGLIAHGFGLDRRLTHVPLIAAGPGAPQTDGVFSLTELPARIAQAAGIADHPYPGPAEIALGQYDALAPVTDPKIVAFRAKFGIDEAGIGRLCADYSSATDGERSLITGGGAERRYDLRADPAELSPLGPESAGEPAFARLRDGLAAGVAGAAGPSAASGPASASAPGATPEELAELEQQMKLLGYM